MVGVKEKLRSRDISTRKLNDFDISARSSTFLFFRLLSVMC